MAGQALARPSALAAGSAAAQGARAPRAGRPSPRSTGLRAPAVAAAADSPLPREESAAAPPAPETLVFRFDAASAAAPAAALVSNAARSGALAPDSSPPGAAAKASSSSAAGSSAKPAAATPTAPAAKPDAAAAKPAAVAPKAASAPKAAAPKAKKAAPPPPKPADPLAAARAAAAAEVAAHDAAAVLAGKEEWLFLTVPAAPVAGAPTVVYFNRGRSVLSSAPRLELHPGFNGYELAAPAERVALEAAPGAGDFWRATLELPAEAYELTFVVADGEGGYDNNASANYAAAVVGAYSRERWVDEAPDRAERAFLARAAEERAAAERAAAEREAVALARDAEEAAAAVEELKARAGEWRAGAAAGAPPLWRTAGPALAGGAVTLLYNRAAGPLAFLEVPEGELLTLRAGANGWKYQLEARMTRVPPAPPAGRAAAAAAAAAGDAEGEWWEASVELPPDAVALDFVVGAYEHWDNNGGANHRLAVEPPAAATSLLAWADSLGATLRARISEARRAAEAAAAAAAGAREAARRAARDKVEEVRRRQMRHVLFTEPAAPEAGRPLTIHYNPDNAALPGAQRVFLRGGFNRWRHPRVFGPLEMARAPGASHFSATVEVPKDAYSLDFVFGDAPEGEGGRFDNAGGMDFHLPARGAVAHEPGLYVVHVAVEMAPIAKVGGMGDVVTALGRAVQAEGHRVELVLPRYRFFDSSPLLGEERFEAEFEWAGARVRVTTAVVEGLRVWFVDPGNGAFESNTVYVGGKEDQARFEFFCRAALEFLLRTGRQPDILHSHDWSTADVAKAYWTEWHGYGLWRPKVIFTIHNMNYGAAKLGEAAYYSQRFTTVSPTYAFEVGGAPLLAPHNAKMRGILNGIDPDIWDPETDAFLPRGYSAASVEEGKAAARAEVRRRLGMSDWGDKPMVGVVSRLTKQKGTHLIAHAAWRALERGGQFVLLGSAPDPKVQAEFNALANSLDGSNAGFAFAFDEPLSHLIYAACDIIVVPSMFEPCGLTQMIAMRYGAVPVVRHTGGLRDTVFDVDFDKGRAAWDLEGSTNWQADGVDATNGFAFDGADEGALDSALNRALDAYYNDRPWFRQLQARVMRQDWSWTKPAFDYIQLYHAALK